MYLFGHSICILSRTQIIKNKVSITNNYNTVHFSLNKHSPINDDGLTQLSIIQRPFGSPPASSPPTNIVNPNWTSKTSTSWRALGGQGRDPHTCMDIKFTKIKLQYEVYSKTTLEASRFVLLVHTIEIIDQLKSSNINKFMHVCESDSMLRPTHANMVKCFNT